MWRLTAPQTTERFRVSGPGLHGLVLLLLSAISQCACAVGEDISCYCNEPKCITDGYLCRSQAGKCFSQLPYDSTTQPAIHGCIETLPQEDRISCEGEGEIFKTRNEPNPWPILMCCKADMCNYVQPKDSIDLQIFVDNNNGTIRGDHSIQDSTRQHQSAQSLWFKAAVIAVPIAGGFILVVLVLLAVRMLRNDNRRHKHLMQMRRHRGLANAELYVADHFIQKCDIKKAQSTPNFYKNRGMFSEGQCMPHVTVVDVRPRDSVHASVHKKTGYEKISCVESTSSESPYSSGVPDWKSRDPEAPPSCSG